MGNKNYIYGGFNMEQITVVDEYGCVVSVEFIQKKN